MKTLKSGIMVLLLVATSPAASSQDIGGYQAWGSAYINVGINGAMMDAATQSAGAMSDDESASAPAEIDKQDLVYRPSLERRRINLQSFVEKTRKVDPLGARMLGEVFAEGDVIKQIAAGIAPYGFQIDNFADAYSVYWISAWQAAHSDYRDVTYEMAQGVKLQAEDAILSTPEFATADDAIKQELSEAYLIQAVQIGQMQELAKQDKSLERRLAAAVRGGATKSGFDVDAVVLTDERFEPAARK